MQRVETDNYIWIDKPSSLQNLVSLASRSNLLGVDTESNSLYAYREQVCLIQFSSPDNDYLIDPLAVKDLTSLGSIFSDPGIEKIFHAAEYDILCLKRDFDFKFVNIFDTMHASRILGYAAVGLGSILEKEFGFIHDKRFQRADWGKRPMAKELQEYAHLDTHYLISLRGILLNALEEAGRLELAHEDFKRLCQVEPADPNLNGKSYWQVSGNAVLTPEQYTVLAELCSYRENTARNVNKPVFKVLSNQQLVSIAIECPVSRDDLLEKCGLNHALVHRHGDALLNAVSRGLQQKPVKKPSSGYPERFLKQRMDTLKLWRKKTAESLGVESDIVLPRDLVDKIAGANPANLEGLASLMQDTPWRFASYGSQILDALDA